MLDPVATVRKGEGRGLRYAPSRIRWGRAQSQVCVMPDPVATVEKGEGRGLRWVGKEDHGGEESLPSAPLRDWRSTENALAMEIGGHRGATVGGARRQNRAPQRWCGRLRSALKK